MRIRTLVLTITVLLSAMPTAALPQGRGLSEASTLSLAGSVLSGVIVAGSASTIVSGSGRLIVTALEAAGESTVVVLRDASGASTASVRMLGSAVREASVAVGTVVSVAAESTGHALVASGKLIAFIPNELGQALLGSRETRNR